jgi:hypothetical protein
MGLFGALKGLFGGKGEAGEGGAGKADRGAAVEYKGFRIIPAPRPQGGQYLTAGLIEQDGPEGPRSKEFIRADSFSSVDEAKSFAIVKGKQIVDYEGARLFKDG